jgi:hypothetical protein
LLLSETSRHRLRQRSSVHRIPFRHQRDVAVFFGLVDAPESQFPRHCVSESFVRRYHSIKADVDTGPSKEVLKAAIWAARRPVVRNQRRVVRGGAIDIESQVQVRTIALQPIFASLSLVNHVLQRRRRLWTENRNLGYALSERLAQKRRKLFYWSITQHTLVIPQQENSAIRFRS